MKKNTLIGTILNDLNEYNIYYFLDNIDKYQHFLNDFLKKIEYTKENKNIILSFLGRKEVNTEYIIFFQKIFEHFEEDEIFKLLKISYKNKNILLSGFEYNKDNINKIKLLNNPSILEEDFIYMKNITRETLLNMFQSKATMEYNKRLNPNYYDYYNQDLNESIKFSNFKMIDQKIISKIISNIKYVEKEDEKFKYTITLLSRLLNEPLSKYNEAEICKIFNIDVTSKESIYKILNKELKEYESNEMGKMTQIIFLLIFKQNILKNENILDDLIKYNFLSKTTRNLDFYSEYNTSHSKQLADFMYEKSDHNFNTRVLNLNLNSKVNIIANGIVQNKLMNAEILFSMPFFDKKSLLAVLKKLEISYFTSSSNNREEFYNIINSPLLNNEELENVKELFRYKFENECSNSDKEDMLYILLKSKRPGIFSFSLELLEKEVKEMTENKSFNFSDKNLYINELIDILEKMLSRVYNKKDIEKINEIINSIITLIPKEYGKEYQELLSLEKIENTSFNLINNNFSDPYSTRVYLHSSYLFSDNVMNADINNMKRNDLKIVFLERIDNKEYNKIKNDINANIFLLLNKNISEDNYVQIFKLFSENKEDLKLIAKDIFKIKNDEIIKIHLFSNCFDEIKNEEMKTTFDLMLYNLINGEDLSKIELFNNIDEALKTLILSNIEIHESSLEKLSAIDKYNYLSSSKDENRYNKISQEYVLDNDFDF